MTCAAAPDRGSVKLELWGLGREGEVIAELIPEFHRRNPGIRVDVQQMPWTAAHEKLLTAHVGDATPDLAQMGNTWIPEFDAVGALEDLTPFVRRSTVIVPDDYFAGIWATNVIAGTIYGIPWYVDTRLLFYRTDLLAAAGFPNPPRTWDEWLEAMKQLKIRGGANHYPILLPTNEWAQPVLLALQKKAELISVESRGAFRDPRFVEAFTFYTGLFAKGFAPVVSESQVANLHQQFGKGDFAMYITGPWNVGEFKKRLPAEMQDKWATAPLPNPDRCCGPGVSLAGGSSLVIFRDSPHKEAAWKLIEFLSEPAQQIRFYEASGNLPARKSVWRDPRLGGDRHLAAFGAQLEQVVPTPKVPEWEQIATTISEHAQAKIRGELTLEQALTALDKKTDQILAKRRWVLSRKKATASSSEITRPRTPRRTVAFPCGRTFQCPAGVAAIRAGRRDSGMSGPGALRRSS